jgi:hypothetical protein
LNRLATSEDLSRRRENYEDDGKKAKRDSDASLPPREYLDFLKDLRDILNLHKDHLLMKLSVFCMKSQRNTNSGSESSIFNQGQI